MKYGEFFVIGEPETWMRVVLPPPIGKMPYEVSDLGRVRRLGGRILKPYKRGQRKGTYLAVKLYRSPVVVRIDLHRLVAMMFLPNPDSKPEVNHLDLNPFDPRLNNLEWCTRAENEAHKHFMKAWDEINA